MLLWCVLVCMSVSVEVYLLMADGSLSASLPLGVYVPWPQIRSARVRYVIFACGCTFNAQHNTQHNTNIISIHPLLNYHFGI